MPSFSFDPQPTPSRSRPSSSQLLLLTFDLPRLGFGPARCTCLFSPLHLGTPPGTMATTPSLRVPTRNAPMLLESPWRANRASPASAWSSPSVNVSFWEAAAGAGSGGSLPLLRARLLPRSPLLRIPARRLLILQQNSKCPPPPAAVLDLFSYTTLGLNLARFP